MPRWHLGGEASGGRSLHHVSVPAVKHLGRLRGCSTHPKPRGIPPWGALGRRGCGIIQLQGEGGSSARTIGVGVIRASWATARHPAPAGAVPAAPSGAPPPSALGGHQQRPASLGYEGFHTRLAEPPSWPQHTRLFKIWVTATGRRIHLPTAQTPPQPQEPGLLLLLAASSAQTASNHVECLYSERHVPPPRPVHFPLAPVPAQQTLI